MSGNDQPVIILVQPQMGENIGMCARAMLNCGLTSLRLVSPRDGWPQESARATAADADVVIENAEVYETLDEAVADCHHVFATTARERAGGTKVVPVREAAEVVKRSGGGVAVLFGPEASGLDREAVSRANLLVRFPTNPDFPSLNLAQAVLLFAWEWRNVASEIPELSGEVPAPRGEVGHFIERLERELDASGFFNSEEMKPHSVRQIRSIFHRASPTGQEVKLLHGIVSAFRRGRDSSET